MPRLTAHLSNAKKSAATCGLLAASCLALVFTASAPSVTAAKTYKVLTCSSANYSDSSSKKCEFKEKLKKLQTKEFRGVCKFGSDKQVPDSQNCKKNNSANSCTVTIDASSGEGDSSFVYKSCSCTNWDVTTSHNVKIKINC